MPKGDRPEIVDACRILANTGLTELYTGHVSRQTTNGLLIPAHRHDEGYGLASITKDEIIEVSQEGEVIDNSLEAPSEIVIHTEILRHRTDVNSVVHCHPIFATGLSITGKDLRQTTLASAFLDGPVSVHNPGPRLIHSEAQGASLAKDLGDSGAILIRGHGAVTVGSSVKAATSRMYALERTARAEFISSQFGGPAPEYDDFGGDLLEESGEEFLDDTFRYLRRHYTNKRSPPAFGEW